MRDLQIVSGWHISTGYSAIRFLLGSVDVNGPENVFFFFFSRASSRMSTRKKATGSLEGGLRKEDHIVCGTTLAGEKKR